MEIVGAFPAGIIGATEANLLASAAGENHEHTEMYPSFAAVAEKEGFSEIAAVMRNIAVAEAYHEKRFLALAKDIKEGRMFMREKATVWRCRNCGCLVEGTHAPDLCPACAHPKAHFEELELHLLVLFLTVACPLQYGYPGPWQDAAALFLYRAKKGPPFVKGGPFALQRNIPQVQGRRGEDFFQAR